MKTYYEKGTGVFLGVGDDRPAEGTIFEGHDAVDGAQDPRTELIGGKVRALEMRTFYDAETGVWLGTYDGPSAHNPHAGHASAAGAHSVHTELVDGKIVNLTMKTWYDSANGAYLGSYNGPRAHNPYAGHDPVEGIRPRHTKLVGGAVVEIVAELINAAKADIDVAAEEARMAFVTAGAGQQAIYSEKGKQAEAAAAEANPNPDDYPLLKASIGIEGETIAEVLAVVEATRQAWIEAGARIETARLGGKKAVKAATSAEAVADARESALRALASIRPGE